MSPPKLSIITINKNNREGLRRTIESVVAQTWRDFEFIVIDGASSDGSLELIKKYSDRMDYWVSEVDSGIYGAMNKGIGKASGDYCLFLNSGDTLLPGSLASSLFTGSSYDVIYFPCQMVYDSGNYKLRDYPHKLSSIFFFGDIINHQSTLIKRILFCRIGLYNEDYRHLADLDFWIRSIVLNGCSHLYIPKAISSYDMHGLTSKWNERLQAERDAVLKSHFSPLVYDDLLAASKIRSFVLASKALTIPFRISFMLFRIANYISRRISSRITG